MSELIVIKSFNDIKIENEALKTGSEVYISEKGFGKAASEIVYDTSLIQEELKVQEELKDGDATTVD